jgi:hypothetical protein
VASASERACHRAVQIADEADLRTRAPKGFLSAQVSAASTVGHPQAQRDARLPASGSLLTRRLNDRQIVVKVLADGFEFESRRYRSLSAIAREVTGTRWNGLLFFGLPRRAPRIWRLRCLSNHRSEESKKVARGA